jgi:hypothetical protein
VLSEQQQRFDEQHGSSKPKLRLGHDSVQLGQRAASSLRALAIRQIGQHVYIDHTS